MSPFQPNMSAPNQISRHALSVTASTANQQLNNGDMLRLTNTHATALAYVNFGDKNVVATTSDMPILPGESIVLMKPAGAEYIAHIGSGALTLIAVCGITG